MNIETLTAQVKANEDAEASAVLLINGLVSQIGICGTDPKKLSDLQAALKTSADKLASAVVANTTSAE